MAYLTNHILKWDASTDTGSGVKEYKIYKDGVYQNVTVQHPTTQYTVSSGTSTHPTGCWTVSAVDNNGNESSLATCASDDTTNPSTPTGLSSSNIQETTFTLSWNAASDASGIRFYRIYKGGVLYATTPNNSTSIGLTGLTAGTTSTWTVAAVDNAYNEGSQSSGLNVTQASALTLFGSTSSSASLLDVCDGTVNTSYWHNGAGTYPVVNDIVYTNSSGTTTLNGGSQYWLMNNNDYLRIGSSGNVLSVSSC